MKCSGVETPLDERARNNWLCRTCYADNVGKFPRRRTLSRHSFDSPYSRNTNTLASSPKSVHTPPASSISYVEHARLSKGRCSTCGEACIDQIKGQHIIKCKMCEKYVHTICDRVPMELIHSLVEKNIFVCKLCRKTKCFKRGAKLSLSQMKCWSLDTPQPWNSLSDVASTSSTASNEGSKTAMGRQLDEDTPTLGLILNSEPHIWSRLKIIYSFEYKPS